MLKSREIEIIVKQLGMLDCTEREARIYLQLIQMGPASVQEIARKLDENRVTIHSAVEQLIKRGVLKEVRRGKRRLIAAEDPTVFERLISRKENELTLIRKGMHKVVDRLLEVQAPDEHRPGVEFYEDIEGFKRMLERTLEAKGEFLAIINAGLLSELLGVDYLLDYFERRSKKGIYSRLIFPEIGFGEIVTKRAKEFKIQVRMLPKNMWIAGISTWNDFVSLKSFTHNRLTCTIVENPDIAMFYREVIFEMIWQQAEPVRVV